MPKIQAERGHIYGEVNSIKDIRELNRTIRQETDRVKTRGQLTELKKRNSAGSPVRSPNSILGSSTLEPSSMPNGTTVSAFIGVGMPGTAGMEDSMPT